MPTDKPVLPELNIDAPMPRVRPPAVDPMHDWHAMVEAEARALGYTDDVNCPPWSWLAGEVREWRARAREMADSAARANIQLDALNDAQELAMLADAIKRGPCATTSEFPEIVDVLDGARLTLEGLLKENATLRDVQDVAKAFHDIVVKERDSERTLNAALRVIDDSMRAGMRDLRELLDLPAQGEGTVLKQAAAEIVRLRRCLPPETDRAAGGVGQGSWSVFAEQVAEQRDAARERIAAAVAVIKELYPRGSASPLLDRVLSALAEPPTCCAFHSTGGSIGRSCGGDEAPPAVRNVVRACPRHGPGPLPVELDGALFCSRCLREVVERHLGGGLAAMVCEMRMLTYGPDGRPSGEGEDG